MQDVTMEGGVLQERDTLADGVEAGCLGGNEHVVSPPRRITLRGGHG